MVASLVKIGGRYQFNSKDFLIFQVLLRRVSFSCRYHVSSDYRINEVLVYLCLLNQLIICSDVMCCFFCDVRLQLLIVALLLIINSFYKPLLFCHECSCFFLSLKFIVTWTAWIMKAGHLSITKSAMKLIHVKLPIDL